MTKQNQAAEAKSDNKSRTKAEPAVSTELDYEPAGLARLPAGLMGEGSNGCFQAQAALLGDPRLQTAQRHALAAQIGQLRGNQHLQRLTAHAGLTDPAERIQRWRSRQAVTPMDGTGRISRNNNDDGEERRETAPAATPSGPAPRYQRSFRFANVRVRRIFAVTCEGRYVPRSDEQRRGQQGEPLQITFLPLPTVTNDISGKAAEISRAVMEAEGAIDIAPGLSVNVELAALEAQLTRARGGQYDFDPNLMKISVRIQGVLNDANADALLGPEMVRQLRQSHWNLQIRVTVEVSLQAQHLARLERYYRALQRFNEASRELDDVLRRVDLDRAELQRTREQLAQANRRLDDLARRRSRGLRERRRLAGRRLRLRRQRRELRRAERQLVRAIERQQRQAGRLGRAVLAADNEVAEAAEQLPRHLRGVRNRLGQRVLSRLGSKLWARLIPVVGVVLFVYDLYETARYIHALATGRARFGTEQGAERAAERPAESLEEARPGAGEEGRGEDIEERVHVPEAEEDIGGGGTSAERIEGAEEAEGAGEAAPEGEREPEERAEEAPEAEARGGPGGMGPTEEAPEEAEEALPESAEVSEWEFEEEEVVEARPAEARGEGFRNFLEQADAQMAAYGCAVRFVPLEDVFRVEAGQRIQGMAAVRIAGGQVIGGYPVTCTIDALQPADGGSRITAISLSPFDGWDAEGNFVAEVPSIRVAIEMATGRAPREEEGQLEGTATDLPQGVARGQGAAGR